MEGIVHHDIIFANPEVTFTQLDPAVQTKIIADGTVRGAVIEVDVPAVIAAPAVVANDVRFDCVERDELGRFAFGHGRRAPVTVAPPGIKTAVIARFQDGVKYI